KDKENKNAKGAEAKYYLTLITYKKGNVKKAQDMVYELDEKYANQAYWVARGYVLLGQTYLDQKDYFNARAIFKSLLDNYTDQKDGILEESRKLLQQVDELEAGQGNETR